MSYHSLIENDHLGDWSPDWELFLATDVSTTYAEDIFRVKVASTQVQTIFFM